MVAVATDGEIQLPTNSNDLSNGVPGVDRPADFDDFWSETLREARGHGLSLRMVEDTLRSDERVQMYQVRYTSLERVWIFGWLAVPRAMGPHPGVVMLPGYSMRPNVGVRNMAYEGLATLWVSVRGHDFDSALRPGFPNYLTHNITDRFRYIYRGAYCDALLGVDLIKDLSEIDADRIAVVGSSQGGALAIVATALSEVVSACAPDVPFLTNFKYSVSESRSYPYAEISDLLRQRPELEPEVWDTLSYFDIANFASLVKCPTLLSVGLDDDVCPPAATLAMSERLGGEVELRTYPETGHEHGGLTHQHLKLKWLKERLGL